jgi:hypothetical protein
MLGCQKDGNPTYAAQARHSPFNRNARAIQKIYCLNYTGKTMLITLDVPNDLGKRLSPFTQQLPQLLELGLREFSSLSHSGFHSVNEVLELLAKLPSAEEIIALRPAKELQQRVNQLLEKQGTVGLTAEEEREWQHYEYLEHLVRIAKTNVLLKLNG